MSTTSIHSLGSRSLPMKWKVTKARMPVVQAVFCKTKSCGDGTVEERGEPNHGFAMATQTAPEDLTGHMLIAMPGMGDPRFAGSVIFLCAHSPEGAMGLIVNKAIPEVNFPEMLRQLGVAGNPAEDVPVGFGGPVETGRGFVLHSTDYLGRPDPGDGKDGTLRVDRHFSMTATLDILEDIACGRGPRQAFMALGYAGWGPQQLEAEIGLNGWLTCPADPDLVFQSHMRKKWEAALATLGIDPLSLSADAGRA